jgi:hypothetical protein
MQSSHCFALSVCSPTTFHCRCALCSHSFALLPASLLRSSYRPLDVSPIETPRPPRRVWRNNAAMSRALRRLGSFRRTPGEPAGNQPADDSAHNTGYHGQGCTSPASEAQVPSRSVRLDGRADLVSAASLVVSPDPPRLRRVNPQGRKALIRLAIMFGWIPVAYVIGSIAGSVNVFVVVMAVGLVVSLVLRFTVLR